MAEPSVEVHIGRLPPFWGHSALFFANLLSIFFGNEGKTQALSREVSSLRSYGGRLLPIINLLFRGEANLLAMGMAPDAALRAYFEEVLVLELPEVAVMPHEEYLALGGEGGGALAERLAAHPAPWVDGFVTDPTLSRIAARLKKQTLSSPAGSSEGNNKLLLHKHLEKLGLPLFDTRVAQGEAALIAAVREILGLGYQRAVIRSQIGASGIGMIMVDHPAGPSGGLPPFLFEEGPCLVQGWLDDSLPGVRRLGSPSVQLFIGPGAVHLYDITDQFLSQQSVHEGNAAPPPSLAERPEARQTLLDQGSAAAVWLHGRGYRGTASVDFLLIERDGATEAIVCEINARVTGATYPAVLARHFQPSGAWLMRNLLFDFPVPSDAVLAALGAAGLLWRPGMERGVLPVNFNPSESGGICKGQFLCLGPKVADCEAVCAEVTRILPAESRHDRD